MTQEHKSPNGNFSQRVDSLMNQQGLNGVDLAARAGMTPTAVSRYKQGRIPAAEELHRLACAFGVTMEYLLTGHGPAPVAASAGETCGQLKQARVAAEKLARQLGEAEATARALRDFLGL
jgi:transcriptional regulator with XRE-family HTH domain